MPRFGAVILAAGGSSRLGEPKQLLLFEGKTLLERIAETALCTGAEPVVVVLGAAAEKCREALAGAEVQILENAAWREGMASSIRVGIGALPEAIDGAFILLCDQPQVTPALLRSLIDLRAPVAASSYDGVAGPPIYFSRTFFPELLLLEGDTGAKNLLRKHFRAVVLVEFPGGLQDVDTPRDREHLKLQESATSTFHKTPVF